MTSHHFRRVVDDRGKPGQFILTGSAAPADDATRHTGAGRIICRRMRPITLFETGHSSGTLSLAWLPAGEAAPSARHRTSYAIPGPWLGADPQKASEVARVLGLSVEQVGRTRSRLIDKGLLYTPGYGLAAFTVPQFDRYLIRTYPLDPGTGER